MSHSDILERIAVSPADASPAAPNRSTNALPNPDYELIPGYRELLAEIDETTRREALELFLPEFQARYLKYLSAPPRDFEAADPGEGLLASIQRDGCVLATLDAKLKSRLVKLTTPHAEALEAKIDGLPKPSIRDSQLILSRDAHGEMFEIVHQAFARSGLYRAGELYTGRRITLNAMTIQVNNVRETKLKYGEIESDGLPVHKGRYFHIDSTNWPPLKVLIYLTPVTLKHGPLRYVKGSHRIADDFEIVVRKTNDRIGLSSKHFMALPRPFRMNTHFGDNVPQDAPEMQALIRNEIALADGVSDMAVFDNTGVHRGGFMRKGRRYIMQCSLCQES